MRPQFAVIFATLSLVALSACSRSQTLLPSDAFSSGSRSAFPLASSSPSPCATFVPPRQSLGGVYDIPSNASGPSAECAVDEALASGQEVVGYGDTPFFWQAVTGMSQPMPMPSAEVSSPPHDFRFEKEAPPGAPPATVFNGALPLSVVAAYRSQTDGIVNTFQGYADSTPILDRMLHQWWLQANPGLGVEAPADKTIDHDANVWMELGNYSSSVQINDAGRQSGTASTGFRVYRMNTSNPQYDTFLVTVEGLNKVTAFNNCKYEFPRFVCEWINTVDDIGLRVNFHLSRPYNASTALGQITEAQPKNSVTSGSYSISEGFDLKGEVNCAVGNSAGVSDGKKSTYSNGSCGVNAGGSYNSTVTQTWDTKSRAVHNFTAPNGTTADWSMTFSGWGFPTCTDKGRSLPADLKTAGDFGAAAIIRIPRDVIYGSGGQPRLMLVASYQGGTSAWEYLTECAGHAARSGSALYQTFDLPTFFVNPTTVVVKAGSKGQFVINSKRPDLDTGLMPSLWLFQGGEILDPAKVGLKITADDNTAIAILTKNPNAVPKVQTWTITAGPTAVKGTYKLFVDTSPGGETDTTRRGAIAVVLTIN